MGGGSAERPNGCGRHLNVLYQGQQLVEMLALPVLCGHVGQVLSPETRYKDLEGPVFGIRCAILYSDNYNGPWLNEQAFLDLKSEGRPRFPGATPDSDRESPYVFFSHNSNEKFSNGASYKMILYKTTSGAEDESTIDDYDTTATLPGAVKQQILQKLKVEQPSHFYPMETVPEDSPAQMPVDDEEELSRKRQQQFDDIDGDKEEPGSSSSGDSLRRRRRMTGPLEELPEERIEDENAEPDSDEERAPAAPEG